MLENIEKSIVYTQNLEIDDNFIELVVKHLNSIDADLTNKKSSSTEALENMKNKSSTVHPLGTSYIPSLMDTSLLQMNRFHPLQHINNNTHFYQPPTKSQPSVTKPLPLVPGPKLYSESVKDSKTTMIITDSMSGGVKASCIKKNIKGKDDKIIFKRFPGATAEEISYYAQKPLSDQQPDTVIIVAGTNDITRASYDKDCIDEFEVVENLMKIARTAHDHGAKKIHVSSIMVRRGHRYSEAIKKINDLLFMVCVAENFEFMDQADITMAHISADGIHLNSHGTSILLYNISSVFNTFDGNSIDFIKDYEYAKSLS